MKIVKPIALCLFFFTSILIAKSQTENAQTNGKDSSDMPEISFKKVIHDYGKIKQGSDGSCVFFFTNTGKKNLVLGNVASSCGCTVPTWPRDTIKPGCRNAIKVVYDTKRLGHFEKVITVMSNAKTNIVELHIKGIVKKQKK